VPLRTQVKEYFFAVHITNKRTIFYWLVTVHYSLFHLMHSTTLF